MQEHCRIGKVKMKSGCEITRIHQQQQNTSRDFMSSARKCVDRFGNDIDAYAIVVAKEDGAFYVQYDWGKQCNPSMFPHWAADCLHKYMYD